MREGGGLGAQIVADRRPDVEAAVAAVRGLIPWPPPTLVAGPGSRGVQRPFRVVELEGTPEEWERQLNGAAQLGYELVQIVDRRAILSCANVVMTEPEPEP
jgi:hypothetical protein